jgi:hypothetical protein
MAITEGMEWGGMLAEAARGNKACASSMSGHAGGMGDVML